MKPIWEQELEHDGKGSVWVKGSPSGLRHEPPDGHAMSREEVFAWGQAIAALPQALHVLRLVGMRPCCSYEPCELGSGTACVSCQAIEVLKAAGVET